MIFFWIFRFDNTFYGKKISFLRFFYLNKRSIKPKWVEKCFNWPFAPFLPRYSLGSCPESPVPQPSRSDLVVWDYVREEPIGLILPKNALTKWRLNNQWCAVLWMGCLAFGIWHLAISKTITTLLRQDTSCQLNLFLPITLAVYFFNHSMKALGFLMNRNC